MKSQDRRQIAGRSIQGTEYQTRRGGWLEIISETA